MHENGIMPPWREMGRPYSDPVPPTTKIEIPHRFAGNFGSWWISVKIIELCSFLKTKYFEFIEFLQYHVKVFVIESH